MTQYYVMKDLKLLRDLIIEIISKGYYPIVYAKTLDAEKWPTVAKTEEGISYRVPIEDKLVLLTSDELTELGMDADMYVAEILGNLGSFFHGSPTTARIENEPT